MQEQAEKGWGLRLSCLLTVPYVCAMLPNGIALSLVMLQRASMGGAAPPPFTPFVADALSAGVVGLVVLGVGGGLAPWLAHACRPRLRVRLHSACNKLDGRLCAG